MQQEYEELWITSFAELYSKDQLIRKHVNVDEGSS